MSGINNQNQSDKQPWDYLGITEEEYHEKEKRANGFLNDLFQEHLDTLTKAKNKYRPLVHSLTDMEFAGLFQIVMEERETRMAKLMLTNPGFRMAAAHHAQQEIDKINQQIKDGEN